MAISLVAVDLGGSYPGSRLSYAAIVWVSVVLVVAFLWVAVVLSGDRLS